MTSAIVSRYQAVQLSVLEQLRVFSFNNARRIRFSLLLLFWTGFDYLGFTRASLDRRGDGDAAMESCEPVYLAV